MEILTFASWQIGFFAAILREHVKLRKQETVRAESA